MRILAGWGILEPHPPRDDTPFLSLLTVELAVSGSGAGQRPAVDGWRVAPVVYGRSQTTSNENRVLRYSLKVHCYSPPRDRALVQIVDSALADAARRSGEWLVCRPGCTQCCIGVFPINQLDAARLRDGSAKLEVHDPARAARVRERARAAVVRLAPDFPGDAAT